MTDKEEKESCKELTPLVLNYRLGIAGEPRTYFLEPIDYHRIVRIDDDGRLHFHSG